MPTVACVLRSGGDFDAEYVRRLRAAVQLHLDVPHRFVCLSDVEVPCLRVPLEHDWPGWWAKMEVFNLPSTFGDVLYFDLDTMIVGDLGDIAGVDRFVALSDFNRPNRLGSGVMYVPPLTRARIWERWIEGPQFYMRMYRGDQEFIETSVDEPIAFFQHLLPNQITSYKLDVRTKGISYNTRVVCFHDKPRPHTIGWSLEPRTSDDVIADSWAPEVKCSSSS